MDHRTRYLLLVSLIAVLLFMNSPIQAASDIIIVVTPTVEKNVQGSVAEKAPTSFSDIITPGPEVSGLVDTQEALRKASSVDLSDYGGAQTSPVMLRGSDFQQTLIMLDGIPMNPVTGDIVDISRFMLPDLDQVEIIKGSNSADFGKAAMGGVINLVTKNPAMVNEYDFTASQGTYDDGLYHGHISTHAGEVGILANLTHAFADNGFRYQRDNGTWTRRENNGTNNTTGLMKAMFDVKGWQTSLMGNFIDQQSGSPGSEGTAGFITPNDKVNFNQDTYLVETKKILPDDQLLDMRVWMVTNRTHNESEMFGNSITRLVDKNFSAAYTKKIGIFTLTPGVQYLWERMNSNDFGIHTRSTASGSFSTDIDIKPVFVDLSGRYDHSYYFKDWWSYHAGAVWNVIDHVQLKTNAGTGYLEPTMGQLYAPSTFFTFIRNPDLKPESSFSWDIGPSFSMNTYGFSIDYFITTFRDLIKMDFPAPNSFSYINVNKAKATGIEASGWVAPVSAVMLSSNYILNDYTFESGPFKGKNLKQKPPQVLNLQADYFPEIAGRNTSFTASYQFRQGSYADEANTVKTNNRYLLNAGVVIDVNRNASISFKADNLLNDRSREFLDKTSAGIFWYPVSGRTYRLATKITF